jgi:hypothetical protein
MHFTLRVVRVVPRLGLGLELGLGLGLVLGRGLGLELGLGLGVVLVIHFTLWLVFAHEKGGTGSLYIIVQMGKGGLGVGYTLGGGSVFIYDDVLYSKRGGVRIIYFYLLTSFLRFRF